MRISLLLTLVLLMNGSLFSEEGEDRQFWLQCDPIHENLPFFDKEPNYERWDPDAQVVRATGSAAVTNGLPMPVTGVVDIRITRSVYPAEDRSVDLVVWFDGERYTPQGHRFRILLKDVEDSGIVWQEESDVLQSHQNFLSVRLTEGLAGKTLQVEITLLNASGVLLGSEYGKVRIAEEIQTAIESPSSIQILGNAPSGVPVRVGVPLPRGFAWAGDAEFRLYDGRGNQLVVDVVERARWSRLGSLKWIAADFIATEGPYQMEVVRTARHTSDKPAPLYKKGDLLNVEDVVRLAQTLGSGKESGAHLVSEGFLTGGFIEKARGVQFTGWRHDLVVPGNRYEVPPNALWEILEYGENILHVRGEGWYVNPNTGEQFCRYKAWLRVYRDSPCLDFEYQWVFTGDGDRDTIRNMGWRMPVENVSDSSYLLQDVDGGTSSQVTGDYLLQYRPDSFEVRQEGKLVIEGNRSTGMARVKSGPQEVWMGVRDFWENYPAEIQAGQQGLTFFLWPQHGKERSHFTTLDNAYRLWFVHEGETLAFALPREWTEGTLYKRLSGPEPPFAYGQPETVNAQGIAKGTRLRFVVTSTAESREAQDILHAWNQRENDLYVDPQWMEFSGVFPSMSARRAGVLEELEQDYAIVAEWPESIRRTFQVYGKWIYGDIPMVADVETGNVGIYRGYKKAHWGWPYSWIPFARSGNAAYRRYADIATRMMVDTAWCHYVSDELKDRFAAFPPRLEWAYYQPFRAIGWNNEGVIPWAGGYWGPTSRMYCDKVDHLFEAWYLDGYEAGREVAQEWMAQTKVEEAEKFGRGPIVADPNRGRWVDNLLRQYLLVYEETSDPWFIMAAHALADMLVWREQQENSSGHFWQGGAAEYLRYSGDPVFEPYFMRYANRWLEPKEGNFWLSLAPGIEPAITAFELSGKPWLLNRATGFSDQLAWTIRRDTEPEAYHGWLAVGGTNEANLFYSWYLRWAPRLFRHLAQRGESPDPVIPLAGSFFYHSPQGEYEIELLPDRDVRNTEIVLSLGRVPEGGVQMVVIDFDGKEFVKEVIDAKESRHILALDQVRLPLTLKLSCVVASESTRGLSLRLPIADHDVGERVKINQQSLNQIPGKASFWMKVRATDSEIEPLDIVSRKDSRFPLRRISVADEQGRIGADWQILNRDIPPKGANAKIAVPGRGKLMRLSTAAPVVSARLPEAVEPWFSTTQSKWFEIQDQP